MRIRKVHTLAASAAAAATLIWGGSAPAVATPVPQHTGAKASVAASGKHLKPALNVFCIATAATPFFVTSGGPLYAQAKITSCSAPKPQLCRLDVALEGKISNTGLWHTYANKLGAWKTCAIGTLLNAPYTCAQRIQLVDFRTAVTLDIQDSGQAGTGSAFSSTYRTNC
jgi:hypothetical protein